MHLSAPRPWVGSAMLAAIAYPATGVLFGALASGAPAGPMRSAWRLAAFGTSGIVFLAHIAYEHAHRGSARGSAPTHVALAVAIGALLLAAIGPARHYGLASRQAALALVIWPLLTGLPAWLAAWVLTALAARRSRSGDPRGPGVD